MTRANLTGANLNNANLHGANLHGANLNNANLHGANLSETDLSNADLSEANLQETDLFGADLSGAYLSQADLRRANLREANLREANLHGANLSETDLHEADLTESIMDEVNFNLADLSGADITGAIFWGALTAGWTITGIKARYAYFCRAYEQEKERHRRNFGEGQFENLFISLPTVELVFQTGLNPTELFALNVIFEEIQRQNPELGIRMAEMSTKGSRTRISIETKKDEYLEKTSSLIKNALEKTFENGIPLSVLTQTINEMFLAPNGVEIGPVASQQPVSINIGKLDFSVSYVSFKKSQQS